jgi:hypothetical protein
MATKEDYNDVPVEFCSKATCCSLNIKEDEDGSVYCNDCGCLKTTKAHIKVWEEYWMMAHGEKFLTTKHNG